MNSSDFMHLLSADHYSPADLEEVEDLCMLYPMFNLAHMLQVRIREALGRDNEKELKRAAVFSSDRKRLYDFVHEMSGSRGVTGEEGEPPAGQEGIQFSDEPHQQADVIIEQHAPYATTEADTDLLEIDDEEEKEEGPEEELTSETIVGAFMKDEEDMEEPEVEHPMETPAIDVVEKERDSERERLIRDFIRDNPGPIRADMETELKGDVSLASVREHDGFITDTLAKIYVKQGLYAKAIYAYEKLSLKYPEKSAYFAAQIEKIKNINYS
jgi:hypothetical protein